MHFVPGLNDRTFHQRQERRTKCAPGARPRAQQNSTWPTPLYGARPSTALVAMEMGRTTAQVGRFPGRQMLDDYASNSTCRRSPATSAAERFECVPLSFILPAYGSTQRRPPRPVYRVLHVFAIACRTLSSVGNSLHRAPPESGDSPAQESGSADCYQINSFQSRPRF
jgi:hypothetical protein